MSIYNSIINKVAMTYKKLQLSYIPQIALDDFFKFGQTYSAILVLTHTSASAQHHQKCLVLQHS